MSEPLNEEKFYDLINDAEDIDLTLSNLIDLKSQGGRNIVWCDEGEFVTKELIENLTGNKLLISDLNNQIVESDIEISRFNDSISFQLREDCYIDFDLENCKISTINSSLGVSQDGLEISQELDKLVFSWEELNQLKDILNQSEEEPTADGLALIELTQEEYNNLSEHDEKTVYLVINNNKIDLYFKGVKITNFYTKEEIDSFFYKKSAINDLLNEKAPMSVIGDIAEILSTLVSIGDGNNANFIPMIVTPINEGNVLIIDEVTQ